jgi:hypothetical protein
MITFTPKKFFDILSLNSLKLVDMTKRGVDRSVFIPRYKKGTKRMSEIDYDYKKRITKKSIKKITNALKDAGVLTDENEVFSCFLSDNFDILIPRYLL